MSKFDREIRERAANGVRHPDSAAEDQAPEHQMAYELDPFSPEFDEAAEKLRKLKAALYSAGVKKSNYHYETAQLEHEAARRSWNARGNQPEI